MVRGGGNGENLKGKTGKSENLVYVHSLDQPAADWALNDEQTDPFLSMTIFLLNFPSFAAELVELPQFF